MLNFEILDWFVDVGFDFYFDVEWFVDVVCDGVELSVVLLVFLVDC